jgi:hypothetical protein
VPKEVDKIFVGQPLDLGGRGLDPLGPLKPPKPSRYFELPIMNPSKPPLPPNRPYHQPLNYLKYLKDSNPNVNVKVFKAAIRTNSEINDAEIVNLFNFTLSDTM